ncbi:MAG: GerMN domain-containing protein [Acidimicrobiia bacterium]
MRRLLTATIVLALATAAGGGCGVPTDETARDLPAGEVPADLAAAEPAVTTTTAPPSRPVDVTVYMMGTDRLVAVNRQVGSPATPEKVVAALQRGPNEEEVRRGLRTAMIRATVIRDVSTDGTSRIAQVDFEGFLPPAGPEQVSALAQIVYTLTELDNVTGVNFTHQGRKTNVLTQNGSSNGLPLGRAAYARLAPLYPTPLTAPNRGAGP